MRAAELPPFTIVNSWLRFRSQVDRIAAIALAIPLLPVTVVVGLLIRLRDGPPVIVRLPRVGRHGVVFGMHKFRTMTVDSPSGLASGRSITAGDDRRITSTGQWLRRRRLDELPQLLDVCRGRMALIGPRPETPEFVDIDDACWRRVLVAAPGIAGLTQLLVAELEPLVLKSQSGEDVYAEQLLPLKLDLDHFYIEHASVLLDLLITVALFKRVLMGRHPAPLERYLGRRDSALAGRLHRMRSSANGQA